MLVGLPPVLVAISLLGRPLVRRAASEQAEAAAATGVATDVVAGLRVLKGIGAEATAIERYRVSSRRSLAATLRAARAEAALVGVGTLLTGGFLAVVALVGGHLVADGTIGLGDFIAAVGLTGYLAGPFAVSSFVVAGVARSRASAARVAVLLGTPVAVAGGAREPAQPASGSLVLDGVGHESLDGLSLRVAAGEHLGVVCADGADGAALVELLVRAADPRDGSIALDGAAYAELDPELLRRVVRVSAHDAQLFDGSLAENVRAQSPPSDEGPSPGTCAVPPRASAPSSAAPAAPESTDPRGESQPPITARGSVEAALAATDGAVETALTATDGAVAAALAAADVADVAAALPGGLDGVLGERGRALSGGQRQRVALARALASGAPVLVLQDPTTAVDAVTEARIASRLAALRAGRTTIVVTSSPALLAAADRVVLIVAGRAVASGSHLQLLRGDERYRAAVLA